MTDAAGATLADLGAVLVLRFADGSRQRVRLADVLPYPVGLTYLLPLVEHVLSPEQIVDQLLDGAAAPEEIQSEP